ncbi:hypothetical protein CRG98_036295 [Punica granatum]|uniref:RNase H type-1 domain-containing protein n=1 Tax=Punica granatum TaxID=22663 RepID=A0A2I0IH35_PUNGR|nr:hypothetical protein CRG98_036295 [Punica granatum]
MKALFSGFPKVVVEHVPPEENAIADSLSKVATDGLEAKGVLFVELLKKDQSHSKEILMNVEEEKCWMTPLREYLDKDVLPSDPLEAKRPKKRAIHYILLNRLLWNPTCPSVHDGTPFVKEFKKFCTELQIERMFAPMGRLETNSFVEMTN